LAAKALVKQTALGIFGSEQGIDLCVIRQVFTFQELFLTMGQVDFS
jgi:hypothetical protein